MSETTKQPQPTSAPATLTPDQPAQPDGMIAAFGAEPAQPDGMIAAFSAEPPAPATDEPAAADKP
jgi:hypothetical protein